MNKLLSKWKIGKNQITKYQNYGKNLKTRFMIKPDGYLNIGHCKSMMINYMLAKRFGGKFVLIFDDININNNIEYKNAITEDIKGMAVEISNITNASEYLESIMEYADMLVKDDLAYIDNINGMEDDNETLWNKMKEGELFDAVLRIKINNNAQTDPIIYKNDDLTSYLYPTYDFICPIIDYIENITHIYRNSEYEEKNIQYRAIRKILGMHINSINSFGKVVFQDEILSNRRIKNELIYEKKVEGWDDPRLSTIRGLKRRGITNEGLITYIAHLGFSKNVISVTRKQLWEINAKVLKQTSVKYIGLRKNNLVEFTIKYGEYEKVDSKLVPKYKRVNNDERTVYFDDIIYLWKYELETVTNDEEVTLINWGNAIIDTKNNTLTLNLDGDHKETRNKLLWVSKALNKKFTVIKYTRIGIEPERKEYVGEYDMINLKKDDFIKMYKSGYYRVDETENNLILIKV